MKTLKMRITERDILHAQDKYQVINALRLFQKMVEDEGPPADMDSEQIREFLDDAFAAVGRL